MSNRMKRTQPFQFAVGQRVRIRHLNQSGTVTRLQHLDLGGIPVNQIGVQSDGFPYDVLYGEAQLGLLGESDDREEIIADLEEIEELRNDPRGTIEWDRLIPIINRYPGVFPDPMPGISHWLMNCWNPT